MMTRRNLLEGAAVMGLGFLSGCARFPTYRYRMTVEVDTPEGVRSGYSVIEVQTSEGIGIPGPEAASMSHRVRGEAVTVDLGARGLLFALLSRPDDGDYTAHIAPRTLQPVRPHKGADGAAARDNIIAMIELKDPVEVNPRDYPTLVRFRDIRDPKSVEGVDPANLATSYGLGAALARIIVQITDDPVTIGIERRLIWLPSLHGSYLDGGSIGNARNMGIHGGKFSTEILG